MSSGIPVPLGGASAADAFREAEKLCKGNPFFFTLQIFRRFFSLFFLRGAADGPSRGRFRLPRRALPAWRKLACFPKASAKVALFPLPAKYFGDYFCENM